MRDVLLHWISSDAALVLAAGDAWTRARSRVIDILSSLDDEDLDNVINRAVILAQEAGFDPAPHLHQLRQDVLLARAWARLDD